MPGLGTSFGRGAATNYQQDLANSDCILFMGSNMAEAHPVGFRWPMKAKEKGATLIHVDPRYTRMSALCDVLRRHPRRQRHRLPRRPGQLRPEPRPLVQGLRPQLHQRIDASSQEGFRDTEDLDGLFSGYHGDGKTGTYDAARGPLGLCQRSRRSETDDWSGTTPMYRMLRRHRDARPQPGRGSPLSLRRRDRR